MAAKKKSKSTARKIKRDVDKGGRIGLVKSGKGRRVANFGARKGLRRI